MKKSSSDWFFAIFMPLYLVWSGYKIGDIINDNIYNWFDILELIIRVLIVIAITALSAKMFRGWYYNG